MTRPARIALAAVQNNPPAIEFGGIPAAKVQRPRLRGPQLGRPLPEARLAAAIGQSRVVLVSAPAGFGKTALVSRVLGEHAACVAWVSLDAEDDPPRLVLALTAALEPYDLPWRMAPNALATLAGQGERGVRLSADAFIGALAGAESAAGVLVLEELHRVRDATLFVWLDRLIEHLPPAWSVVMVTRVDPPLALARLRVQGELTELRADALSFSVEEARALAHQLGADTDIDTVWERTRGWPAGLALALRAGGRGTGTVAGSDRHAFDYLASEVLDQLPAPLRDFLLSCSLLPELTLARCAALTDSPQAALHLDELEARGLFVSVLDGPERTLRLHDLFRDFLEQRLQLTRSDELPALLRRAAAGESDPARRVIYLLRAGDPNGASQVLAQATPAMLAQGGQAQVLRLIGQFPAQLREGSPVLAFVRGMCAWPRFEWVTLHRAMAQAAEGFERMGLEGQARQARSFDTLALISLGRTEEAAAALARLRSGPIPPEAAAFTALLGYWEAGLNGPLEGPARYLDEMVDRLAESGGPDLWYRCLPHFMFLGHPGIRAPMERYARLAVAIAGEHHVPLRAGAGALRAWLLLWEGRLAEAEAVMRGVQEDARWLGEPNNLRIPLIAFRAVLHSVRGERELFDAAARESLESVYNDSERDIWRGVYLYHAGRGCTALDDWAGVEQVAQALAKTPSRDEWPFMRAARAGLEAQLRLHRGDAAGAWELLAEALEISRRHDMFGTRITLLEVGALARLRLGDPRGAWEVLAPALAHAQQPGEIATLLVSGPTLISSLAEADWDGAAPEEALAWLRDAAREAVALRQHPVSAATDEPGAAPVPGGLTERECEVLARIARGEGNKVIARALELSPHTVKRHVANILCKLDLTSRGQAAAWWHARGPQPE